MKRKFRYIKHNQVPNLFTIQFQIRLFWVIPMYWVDIVIADKDSEHGDFYTCTAKSEDEAKMLVQKYETGELKV